MAPDESSPVVTYRCPIADREHAVPGPDVRVLRVGDGGFIVACDCGPESLADVDTAPHETVDHLVNVYAGDPSPAQWLRLEDAADGWHDTTQWDEPADAAGTWGQRRARFRERVREIADTEDGRSLEPDVEQRQAREVACPKCSADVGQKCQRPSGHRVRTAHADRVDRARSAGVIETDDDQVTTKQTDLQGWA